MARGQRAKGRRQQNGETGQGRMDMMFETGRARGRSQSNDGGRGREQGRIRAELGGRPENVMMWANVTQNAMRDFMVMWSDAAQESLRLATELQQAQVDAARDLGRIFTQSADRMRRVA